MGASLYAIAQCAYPRARSRDRLVVIGSTTKSQSTLGGVTVVGRLWASRGASVYLLLLLLTPLLVGLAARQAWVRTSLPDPGLELNADQRIEAFDARWKQVQKADLVVALDGRTLHDPADWVSRALAPRDTPLLVTFERDGERWTEAAHATPIRAVDRVAVWARIATGAALMVMGLVAFVLRPGASVTWLLLLLAWDLGLFLLQKIGLYFDPRLYKQASLYPWAFATAFGLHFLCFFPQKIAWIAERPWRAAVFYLPVFAAPIVHGMAAETAMASIGTLWGAVANLLVVAIVVHQYARLRRSSDRKLRSQYRALLVGFAGGLLIPALWNWLRIALDVWNSPWAAHYNALPLVLFIGVTAYAVVRHNALAIDRFTAAVAGYVSTSVVLAATFAAALIGIPLLLGQSGIADSPVLLVAVTALTFASFAPMHRRIKRWVDRRFFREQADAVQIADALRELVLTMQQSSRDEAVHAAFVAVSILRADRSELWLLGSDKQRLRLDRSTGHMAQSELPLTLDGALGKALVSGMTGGVAELCPRVFEPNAQDELWSRELAMAAPVMVHGVVAGCFGIGRKRSGAGYTLEELSFLTIVAAQLGSVLERAEGDSSQIDRYQLERRLGTGGMAEVFLAWQVGPGGFERKVAIKRPLPHVSEDPNAVAAFLDEARLAAQLLHPNIAQVYDVGESSGTYFIVMEYVDGPSLRQLLRQLSQQKQRVPLAIATSLIVSVLAALDYAHRHSDERGRSLDLVHRDITPRNVLLNRSGQVKLVDFGIARAEFRLHVTRTGTVKGTLPYMSPEQAAGNPLDCRADLYSAGALFYELLTGEMAYPRGPSARRPRPAARYVPELPLALEPVLRRSMDHDAERRFRTAAEQARALLQAIRPKAPASSEEVAAWMLGVCPEYAVTDQRAPATIVVQRESQTTIEPEDLTMVDRKER
jgi:eukaryotic-like serine/threonine-protein kinase